MNILAQIYESLPESNQIKTVALFMILVFGTLFVTLVIKIRKLNKRPAGKIYTVTAVPSPARHGVGARWEEIKKHIDSHREFEWKFAVIEADKLIDHVLKSAGYTGETMGERLINIDKSQLVSLDGLWEAHKIRNKIVHDQNYFLRYAEAKRAIQLYEKLLEELGVI